jgi:hypothetical protein
VFEEVLHTLPLGHVVSLSKVESSHLQHSVAKASLTPSHLRTSNEMIFILMAVLMATSKKLSITQKNPGVCKSLAGQEGLGDRAGWISM